MHGNKGYIYMGIKDISTYMRIKGQCVRVN